MKNVAASSEKRGRGRNRDKHRARERAFKTDRETRRVRHPKTATERETELERNSKSKIHLTQADTRQLSQLMASQGKLPSLDRRARGEKGGGLTVGDTHSARDN